MEPTRAALPGLQSTDPRVFSRWLRGGLEGWFQRKGRDAFTVAKDYVGRDDDITEDLYDLYRCLHPEEQAAFRAGIALALSEMDTVFPDKSANLVAHCLMSLAANVEATDVIDVLPGLVSALRRAEPVEVAQRLVDTAMETAISLATPGSVAKACLHMLIERLAFSSRLASAALIVLCKIDPMGLQQHLRLLWPKLNEQMGWAAAEVDEAKHKIARVDLIHRVFLLVGSRTFTGAVAPVPSRYSENEWRCDAYTNEDDDWWLGVIFLSEVEEIRIIREICLPKLMDDDRLARTSPDSSSGATVGGGTGDHPVAPDAHVTRGTALGSPGNPNHWGAALATQMTTEQ